MRIKVYYEQIPEHYDGDYPSVTIHYRPQDRFEAEKIGLSLGDDLEEFNKNLNHKPEWLK
jgi:hypothetical protein